MSSNVEWNPLIPGYTEYDLIYSISKNLETMERTIASKGAECLDLDFVEIFQKDLNFLRNRAFSERKIVPLSEKLKKIEEKIIQAIFPRMDGDNHNSVTDELPVNIGEREGELSDIGEIPEILQDDQIRPNSPVGCDSDYAPDDYIPDASLLRDVAKPLYDKTQLLDEMIEQNKGSQDVQNGLQEIAKYFNVTQVRGDGHCFYRAVMGQFLTDYEKASRRTKREFLRNVEKFKAFLNPKNCSKRIRESNIHKLQVAYQKVCDHFKRITEILAEIDKGKTSVYEIMQDEEKSNQLVAFLRTSVCEYNRFLNPHRESLIQLARADSLDLDAYLDQMSDMSKALYASEAEIRAAEDVLGVKTVILDAELIGKGEQVIHKSDYAVEGEKRCDIDTSNIIAPKIRLLLKSDHYDLLIPRSSRRLRI